MSLLLHLAVVPIDVTLAGIEILSRDVQFANAASAIDVTE